MQQQVRASAARPGGEKLHVEHQILWEVRGHPTRVRREENPSRGTPVTRQNALRILVVHLLVQVRLGAPDLMDDRVGDLDYFGRLSWSPDATMIMGRLAASRRQRIVRVACNANIPALNTRAPAPSRAVQSLHATSHPRDEYSAHSRGIPTATASRHAPAGA